VPATPTDKGLWVELMLRRSAEPGRPVERGGREIGGERGTPTHSGRVASDGELDLRQLTKGSAGDDLLGPLTKRGELTRCEPTCRMRPERCTAATISRPSGMLCDIGFLAVDILACSRRPRRRAACASVGRGDDHAVDARVVKHLPVAAGRLDGGTGDLLRQCLTSVV